MASVVTGFNGATRQSVDEEFDPQVGYVTVERWAGPKKAIAGKHSAFCLAGYKSKKFQKGPTWFCEARYPQVQGQPVSSPTEAPVDRWKIRTEWAQLDIRSNPKVIAAAISTQTLAIWIRDIDTAISKGEALSGVVSDEQQELYDLKARGAEAYEIRRPVLSRVRTVSAGYPDQFVMDAVEKVWTTAKLITAFGIPNAIKNRLPANPSTTPVGTAWAWKLRAQESDIILATNKVEEVYEWVFAAWSTLLYDVIS